MSDCRQMYIVEYSMKGKTTHIHTVQEMLETNLRNVLDGIGNDYIPIALVGSAEDAMKAADKLESQINQESA